MAVWQFASHSKGQDAGISRLGPATRAHADALK
jgi:hypothetical protein